MPWPSSIQLQSGSVPIDTSFSVAVSGAGASDPRVQFAAASLYSRMARQTGLPIVSHQIVAHQTLTQQTDAPVKPLVTIVVGADEHNGAQRLGDNENYTLTISNGSIALTAEQPLGALRGIETILQLVQPNPSGATAGFSVPAVAIDDQPRFPWRGLSLDVSRHFIPVDGVKRTIDGLAAVKLNVLHWHLSDDQGFRIESLKYPKLQGLGSDGLFYTQEEVRQVIAYASLRGVRIVPEFDMPGHSSSWLPGYPELASSHGPHAIVRVGGVLTAVIDPTKEWTYQFLDNFVGEMADLFPDQYFHIGGDEVDPKQWNQSASIRQFMTDHKLANTAALQAYFNQRLLKIVTAHHKRMEGWDEILHPDLPKTIVIQSWRGQESLFKAAREGYQGILSAGYYLDLMYPAATHYVIDPMISPARKGHDPEPANLTPEQAKLILGGEAAMWEELATAENLDAKLWPRLAAIAERFWSPQNITDIAFMYRRLAVINQWLEWQGLTQRSGLELMRQRLADPYPVVSMDTLASLLEPVKGYVRHQHHYTSQYPFNRLVDSIAPESEVARRFQISVDEFLKAPSNNRESKDLEEQLAQWSEAAHATKSIMQANALLRDDLPVAEGVQALSDIGLDALSFLNGSKAVPDNWKTNQMKIVNMYNNKRVGDLLIQISPGIEKLVGAVK